MPDPVLPAFWQYPKEGGIIGRMVAGYAELEFELAICVGEVLEDVDRGIRTLFRVRGEEARIQTADALLRSAFESLNLSTPYCDMIAGLGWCRGVRNRYAHCHWYPLDSGLCFLDMEAWAKKNVPMEFKKHRLSIELLEEQEAYFRYVQRLIWFLGQEMAVSRGRKLPHELYKLPRRLDRPRPHAGVVMG